MAVSKKTTQKAFLTMCACFGSEAEYVMIAPIPKERVKNACPTAVTKASESIFDQSDANINSTAYPNVSRVVA